MLELISLRTANVRAGLLLPPFLGPLIDAAKRGQDLDSRIAAVVDSFGFDSFEYGVVVTPYPDHNGVHYAYTTAAEWVRRYDQLGYSEVDPRVFLSRKSAIPLIWDQSNVRGFGRNVEAFLDDALAHGIASGVSFMWHGPHDTHVIVALNSRIPCNDEIRYHAITRNLPDIVMFGHYFHEVFVLPALRLGESTRSLLPALSPRELECLELAARGMTIKEIAVKLDISSRTVNFHFERIRTKYGAANRQEAIALAVQAGRVRAQ